MICSLWAVKKRTRADEEGIHLSIGQRPEADIDLVFGAGIENAEASSGGLRSPLQFRQLVCHTRKVRIHQTSYYGSVRNQLPHDLQMFRHQLSGKPIRAGDVLAWSVQACYKSQPPHGAYPKAKEHRVSIAGVGVGQWRASQQKGQPARPQSRSRDPNWGDLLMENLQSL